MLGPEEIDRVLRKWLKRIPLPLRPQDREEISAVSNHFRLPAMAFKITSCTFIIRSVPQRTLADWLLVHLQRGPRSHKRTDHLLIGLDNSHAKNIAFSFAALLLDIPNIR
jgi:hypothetical protein